MWLTNLKIAIIEKNTNKLNDLLEDIPTFEKLEEIEQAIFLLKEATELVQKLKDETAVSMGKIQKNLSFLNATQRVQKAKFDIKL